MFDSTCSPGIAHSKTIIIDNHIVLTGSFNFTYSAQNTNQENIIHMKNIYVNDMFKNNFYKKWDESQLINQSINQYNNSECVVL